MTTIVSQIHNLTAWASSHAYTAGQRVSNDTSPVKAYQCITGGTSAGSGGPTGTSSSISDGTAVWAYLSAVDYNGNTALSSWATAVATGTVLSNGSSVTCGSGSTLSSPVEADMWNDAEYQLSSSMTISGITTSGTNTLTITTAPAVAGVTLGESFRDNANVQTNALTYNQANGVGITKTTSYNVTLTTSINNLFLNNIQINTFTTGNSSKALTVANATTCLIANMILEGRSSNCYGVVNTVSLGTTAKFVNLLVVQRTSSTSNAQSTFDMETGPFVLNCTIVRPSNFTIGGTGIRSAYGTAVIKNCAVFGYTTPVSGTTTSTTNFTDIASPPAGWTGSLTFANQFVTVTDTGRDFKAKAGANLLDAGTTDTNASPDIARTIRPQGSAYDGGCWELVLSNKVIFFKNTGVITLPSDFNTSNNTIESLGESGSAAGGGSLHGGGGGGAGAYAKIVNYSGQGPGGTVGIQVGTGGSSNVTIWDTVNSSCIADYGKSAIAGTAGTGGLAANSTGTTKFDGGAGSDGTSTAGGSGGGAAGPAGAGGAAGTSGNPASGAGGTANNGGQAGALGVSTTAPGNPGIAQTPAVWTQTSNSETASPSSGASGAGGLTLTSEAGGDAVNYGGAPGGGNQVAAGSSFSGAPSPGLIVVTYVPLGATSFGPWFEFGSNDAANVRRGQNAIAY